jgi:DNA-directed RNA polymerase subunit RPC12/RpoP
MDTEMSSQDPCKCEEQRPGYGGMCKTCGKECFRQEMDDHPYRCRECGNLAMYRSDHQPSCVHYPTHAAFHGRES